MSPEANYPKMPIHIIEDEKRRKKRREGGYPSLPLEERPYPPEEKDREDDKPQSGVTEWQM